MSNFRRLYVPNGTYFFTVVTHGRVPLFANAGNVERLRSAIDYTAQRRPFSLDAFVILPDHLHCIWTMTADCDFSKRWWEIKTRFARGLPRANGQQVKQVWQKRFWEHLIRDSDDLRRHLDYIHYNPVKHGYANKPDAWVHSSFGQFVGRGFYPEDWGGSEPEGLRALRLE